MNTAIVIPNEPLVKAAGPISQLELTNGVPTAVRLGNVFTAVVGLGVVVSAML